MYQGPDRDIIHPKLYKLAIKGVEAGAATGQVFMEFDVQGMDTHIAQMLGGIAEVVFSFHTSVTAMERERAVIRQEMYQDAQDRQYEEWLMKSLLPDYPHLQHKPAGTEEVVQNITVDALKRFHSRYFYGRNSALVVAGSVHHQEVLDIASGLDIPNNLFRPNGPDKLLYPRYGRHQYCCDDRPPEVILYFPGAENEEDDALIAFVCDMLAGSMLSLLIRRLRHQEQKIYNAGANPWGSLPLNCTLVGAPTHPDLLDEVEREIMEEIFLLASGDVDRDLFPMVKNQWADHHETWEWETSADDWVEAISEGWLMGNLMKDVHRGQVVAAATMRDIMRVVEKYFCGKHGCVHVLPATD